ncbi:MAG: DNA replication/repair protein RecF [Tissierellia bacterium]|nr:DNA replication/repair protein RecF [Tissierellia bacterium]
MIIKELKLINHRNYINERIIFHENTNILIGKNAQGKTNLLEAIFLCARGYSFKSLKEEKIINFNKEESYLKAQILIGKRKRSVEIKLSTRDKKLIRINELEIESLKEMKSQFGVVIFSPEELRIIKDTPSIRRKFIDDIIINNDILYKKLLTDYNKIRFDRNNLLKRSLKDRYSDQMMAALDRQLVEYGSKIAIYRYKYTFMLKEFAKKYHRILSSSKESLDISYDNNFTEDLSSLEAIKKEFLKTIEDNKNREHDQATSLYGPHKDDLRISINDLDTRVYASQGQQRTAMLSLKLAEAKLIENLTGVKPILLLDDVFSELDVLRSRLLVEAIKGYQTIITTNDLNNLNTSNMYGNVYKIEAGKIEKLETGERK